MSDKVVEMTYVGEVPWHGRGIKVTGLETPKQIMEICGADFEVFLTPSEFEFGGIRYKTGDSALYRMVQDEDHIEKPFVLSNVSDGWKPNQNHVAFDFFCEEAEAGDMSIETAGVLDDGKYVWCMAKLKEGAFEAVKGKDIIEPYFLFVNPHVYGKSITTMFTPTRVVCWNTMTLAVATAAQDKILRHNHRRDFVVKDVKKKLLVAKKKMEQYQEFAGILVSKRAQDAAVREYFRTLFPMVTKDETKKEKEFSRTASKCLEALNTQPGAEIAEGSWWQAFNAVTYVVDHTIGKDTTSVDTRLGNAWFGPMREKKTGALKLALEMAV